MRKAFIAAALLTVLGLAFGGYWFWSAELLRTGLRDWREARTAEGYRIEHGEPVLNGFPARLVAHLHAPHISTPEGWRWQGDIAQLEADLFAPGHLSLTLNGQQELAALSGESVRQVDRFASRDAALTIELAPDGQPWAGTGRLAGYQLSGGARALLRGNSLTFDFQRASIGSNGETVTDFETSLRQVDLSRVAVAPLGERLHALDLRGRLVAWPRVLDASAVRVPWGSFEGRVDIDHLDLRWPPLDLSASGSIGLDEERRPSGRLETWWRDLPGFLEALAASGFVDPQALAPLKAALLLLPQRAGADGRTERLVPISLEEGRLFVGPLEIGQLSPFP
jgi:hypothetical protein